MKPSRNSINYDIHKRLLDHLTTAVLLLDENLKVNYANPAAEQLMAASFSQLNGIEINQLFSDENGETEQELRAALRDLHPITKREAQVNISNKGHVATVDYTMTPVIQPQAGICLLLEIRLLDRLMRISREDNLINSHQATKALVRGVAHEVKNPLGGIRGAAQLLARELPSPALHEYTDIIIAEADRLRNLVDEMLGPRKVPKPAMSNIHEIMERVRTVLMAEAGPGIDIIRDYDPSVPDIWCDKDQLIQAMLNIARNAMQALKEFRQQANPKVILKTRVLRQFTIGHHRHRLVALVQIEDNGPGIKKELQETMFYPMISGRAAGTGLGLSISQSIINQHQGLIECDSHPGKTTFSLYLPLEPESVASNHSGV